MKLRLQLVMECPICKLDRNRGDEDELVEIALFGYANFAVCPCCKKQVHDLRYDRNYRRRATRYVTTETKA